MSLSLKKALFWCDIWKAYLDLDIQVEIIQGNKEYTLVQAIKDGRVIPETSEKTAILNGEYDTDNFD